MTAFTPKPRWICCGQTPCVCLKGKIDMTPSKETPEASEVGKTNLIEINGEYYIKCVAHEEVVRRTRENTLAEVERVVEGTSLPPYPHEGAHGVAISQGAQRGFQDAVDTILVLLQEIKKQ